MSIKAGLTDLCPSAVHLLAPGHPVSAASTYKGIIVQAALADPLAAKLLHLSVWEHPAAKGTEDFFPAVGHGLFPLSLPDAANAA